MDKIKRWRIETEKLVLINNDGPDGEFEIKPNVTLTKGLLDGNQHYSEISVEIKGDKEHQFPFILNVVMRIIFDFETCDDMKGINDFMSKQAAHILYPYVRSAVTGLTQTAMLPPVVLPLVDAMTFFIDKEGQAKN